MLVITLSDGSIKEFSEPVTAQKVAESVCAGLVKSALSAKVDDRWGRYFIPNRGRCGF